MAGLVYIRGGGDLASGVALRLHHVGLRILITELPQPLVVRRKVSFAEAIYAGQCEVENVVACRSSTLDEAVAIIDEGKVPLLVDPQAETLDELKIKFSADTSIILIDARMNKGSRSDIKTADLVIGLGPGFEAGINCHAVIETNRGHRLGRVIWQGMAENDTGIPDRVVSYGVERVLRSPADGIFNSYNEIGKHVEKEQLLGDVGGEPVKAPFPGVIRGLLHSGIHVNKGMKIGDVDPRDDPAFCSLVSEKSLAIGGGVLEVMLSIPELRKKLWE
jgi:xanthine dehydrogenase accessory factor